MFSLDFLVVFAFPPEYCKAFLAADFPRSCTNMTNHFYRSNLNSHFQAHSLNYFGSKGSEEESERDFKQKLLS